MAIVPKNLHRKYGLNTPKTKELQSKIYLTQTHRLGLIDYYTVVLIHYLAIILKDYFK